MTDGVKGIRLGLRLILFVGFTLVSAVPVLFLAYWVQETALGKEVDAVKEKHLLVAHNLTGAITRYLNDVKSGFQMIAHHVESDMGMMGARELMESLKIRSLWILEKDGTLKGHANAEDKKQQNRLTPEIARNFEKEIAAARRVVGSIVFSNLVKDGQGKPSIFVTTTLSSGQNVIGVLDMDYIIAVQKAVTFGKRGHAAIVDGNGRVMAHPVPAWRESMKDISFLPPVKRMMAGETGVSKFYTPAMQADMIAGFATVPGVGWGIMIPQPFEELEERAIDVRRVAIVISVLGIFIAGIISMWLVSIVAHPIQVVVDAAREFAVGNMKTRAREMGRVIPKELMVLINSFNVMVDEVGAKEEKLRKLSRAVEQSPASVVITDKSGAIEYVNPKFVELTGYTPSEAIGKNPRILKSGYTSDDDYRKLWGEISAGKEWRGEFYNRRKNGEMFWGAAVISPITGEDGKTTHYLSVTEDITLRKEYEERLLFQANFDGLTKLPNRTLFFDRLTSAIATARRQKRIVALLFIDLDRFKGVNDTLGHTIGDSLLKRAAERLSKCVREADSMARLGGDEFAVLLQDVKHPQDASIVAKKIIETLSAPFSMVGREIFVGASIGITVFPGDGNDSMEMLRNADVAMYQAKDSGRGTYRYFKSSMNDQAMARMELEGELRQAVENEEFMLHYQPIIDLGRGMASGAEALVRWNHPERGIVYPGEFIPLVEETGLIAPLGKWIMRKACEEARNWTTTNHGIPYVSVNLSSRQINLGFSPKDVADILAETGLPPDRLILEITESMIMEHRDFVTDWLYSVKKTGVRISVDDFGTGYSSLSYLKRFPVDIVKIDRSFINDISTDEESAALVEGIIAMSHSLSLAVVAEGVENIEQQAFLQNLNCEYGQGYYFCKPAPAEEIKSILTNFRL